MPVQFCPIDAMTTDECPHVCCVVCSKVPSSGAVCGGCFCCDEHHSVYSECADWKIQVEVIVVTRSTGEDL